VGARSAEGGTWFGGWVRSWGVSLLMLALAAWWPERASAGDETPVRAETASPSRLAALYANLPLSFEINQGQADPRVKYLAHGQGYTLWLTADQAVLALHSSAQLSTSALPVVRLKLVGSDPAPGVWGEQPLPGRINYFLGNDPKKWRTNVPTYAKVKYVNIYPGVDLVYYGNPAKAGQLEYDFMVRPGADPRAITLELETEESKLKNQKTKIDKNGDLVVGTEGGEVIFH
jgi:hypothetical protein